MKTNDVKSRKSAMIFRKRAAVVLTAFVSLGLAACGTVDKVIDGYNQGKNIARECADLKDKIDGYRNLTLGPKGGDLSQIFTREEKDRFCEAASYCIDEGHWDTDDFSDRELSYCFVIS